MDNLWGTPKVEIKTLYTAAFFQIRQFFDQSHDANVVALQEMGLATFWVLPKG